MDISLKGSVGEILSRIVREGKGRVFSSLFPFYMDRDMCAKLFAVLLFGNDEKLISTVVNLLTMKEIKEMLEGAVKIGEEGFEETIRSVFPEAEPAPFLWYRILDEICRGESVEEKVSELSQDALEKFERKYEEMEIPQFREELKERIISLLFLREVISCFDFLFLGSPNGYGKNLSKRLALLMRKVEDITASELEFDNVIEGDVTADVLVDFYRSKFKIGIPFVDEEIMSGGYAKGRVYLFAGATGVGKSLFLLDTCIRILENNSNVSVAYITLENTKEETFRRLLSRVSGIGLRRMKVNSRDILVAGRTYRKWAKLIKERGNRFYILDMRGNRPSVRSIFYFLQDRVGIPDVIVVDYLNLLRPRRSERSRWRELSSLIEDFKRYSSKFPCVSITATQLNRGGFRNPDAGIENIAESFSMTFASDFVAVFTKDKEGKIKMKIEKNRNGPAGHAIDISFLYDTMTVEYNAVKEPCGSSYLRLSERKEKEEEIPDPFISSIEDFLASG